MNTTQKAALVFSAINIFMTQSFAGTDQSSAEVLLDGYELSKARNIVARTLFMEARSDYRNNGLQAVASVIWNRAGGDPCRLVSVCFERNQFSVWNAVAPLDNQQSYGPESYKEIIPNEALTNVVEERAWDKCVEFADSMVCGRFESNIGNRNMFCYEESGSNKEWWHRMSDKTEKGEFGHSHIFGYLPERDGYLK